MAYNAATMKVDHGMVWRGLLDADRAARYYERLAVRMGNRHRLFVWGISALSLIVAALSFSSAPIAGSTLYVVIGGVALAIAVGALWIGYADYSRKAGIAAAAAALCSALTSEWEALWFDMDAEDAPARVRDLTRRAEAATAQALQLGLASDRSLNRECTKESDEYWQNALGGERAAEQRPAFSG